MVTLQIAAERVKSEARQIHILRRPATVQGRENIAKFLDMLRGDPSRRPALIESLQPSMPDRSDHRANVFRRLSLVKRQVCCEVNVGFNRSPPSTLPQYRDFAHARAALSVPGWQWRVALDV